MYDWLDDALQGTATVVTANRRLARQLQEEYARSQLRSGRRAWRTPAIYFWQDWLDHLLSIASDQASLPVRLNRYQTQLLWERSLERESGDSATGLVNVARLSREAWRRLADWQVPIRDAARAVQNEDQRRFTRVAGRYLAQLEREGWIDDAGLPAMVLDRIGRGDIRVDGRVTFAGFDREPPIVRSMSETLSHLGVDVHTVAAAARAARAQLIGFENSDAELRAAGAWARARLLAHPDSRIAIIAANLESDAERRKRLVGEGLVPGWQCGSNALRAVNVSYGRRLIEYPAVSIALLVLRWLEHDLTANEVSQLLRSPLIATGDVGERGRMDLRLRQLPDRSWSPGMIASAVPSADAEGWRGLVTSLSRRRREVRREAEPATWAARFDETLERAGWPGDAPLHSDDFQLVNRWREMLIELARLSVVSPSISLGTALQNLERMCAESLFQPESRGASIQLLGPLEASGAEFDALWISGLTASAWPPAGNPSPLLSRRLQREHRMPDSDPADTLEYTEKTLSRLIHSAPVVVCSYPRNEDDAVQTPSGLLRNLAVEEGEESVDPGWYAARLVGNTSTVTARDRVPAVGNEEKIAGGAGTLQRQMTDPFAAFVAGRLGVRPFRPQASGITPALRGDILHDALHRLYAGLPHRDDLLRRSNDEITADVGRTLQEVFARHARNSDGVLFELLRLEQERAAQVLGQFVSADVERDAFEVLGVETQVEYSQGSLRLDFRIDRIDRLSDGTLAVIDYKTGARKSFLLRSGDPRDMQLVAYAAALEEPVAALALAYLDTREVSFSGAGGEFSSGDDWPQRLEVWIRELRRACDDFGRGDVRMNPLQSARDARYLNLLSRYTEIARDRS